LRDNGNPNNTAPRGQQGPKGETGPPGAFGGPPGPQGPPGRDGVDANVTNANVNAAIAFNRKATIEALALTPADIGLENAILGPFPDDQTAGQNGVPLGGIYKKPNGVIGWRSTGEYLEVLISLGDSHTDYGANYNTTNNNYDFMGRGHWTSVGARTRRALSYGRNSHGAPNRQFFYGFSGKRADQLRTDTNIGVPRLIADYGSRASKCGVIVMCGGNDLSAGYASAKTFANIKGVCDDLINSGFRTIFLVGLGPRLYSLTPIDETAILPRRREVNLLLRNYAQTTPGVHYIANDDLGEDPANPGYRLSSLVDTGPPGHAFCRLASMRGQLLAEALSALPNFPTYPAWLTPAFKASALNSPANGNPNGNFLLTGTGTEGSTPVCSHARISVLTGVATWNWETVLRNGRTVRKLTIPTNTGQISLQSNNSGFGAFWALASSFNSESDELYAVCELEGESTNWAFTEIQLMCLGTSGSNFKMASDMKSADNGASGILIPYDRAVLATPPIVFGKGETSGANVRLLIRGTGTLYLDYIGIHRNPSLAGPYIHQ
jgi:hypothetical protein